jgi:DNA-3-methyladenine glycosylase I
MASASPAEIAYHDSVWGRSLPPGSSRALFKQLVLQTFQSGLSWSTILNKEQAFTARFEGWDYHKVARWTESDVAAAMDDAGIVRNALKIKAAVASAAAAVALDKTLGGFEAFCWATCGGLPTSERLLQHASRSGSHMRASERVDFATADGVHPTTSIAEAVVAFKAAGFRFLGPATMLSFMQAAGFVNHHKPDCAMFGPAETAFAANSAAAAGTGGAAGPGLTLSAMAPVVPKTSRKGKGSRVLRVVPVPSAPATRATGSNAHNAHTGKPESLRKKPAFIRAAPKATKSTAIHRDAAAKAGGGKTRRMSSSSL